MKAFFNRKTLNRTRRQKYFFIPISDLNEKKVIFYILGTINVSVFYKDFRSFVHSNKMG